MSTDSNTTKHIESLRRHIVKGVRLINQGRTGAQMPEIESSKAFRDIVVANHNPAISSAHNSGVAYTVVANDDIVEVKNGHRSVVGRVAKHDIHLAKGMTYKLSK